LISEIDAVPRTVFAVGDKRKSDDVSTEEDNVSLDVSSVVSEVDSPITRRYVQIDYRRLLLFIKTITEFFQEYEVVFNYHLLCDLEASVVLIDYEFWTPQNLVVVLSSIIPLIYLLFQRIYFTVNALVFSDENPSRCWVHEFEHDENDAVQVFAWYERAFHYTEWLKPDIKGYKHDKDHDDHLMGVQLWQQAKQERIRGERLENIQHLLRLNDIPPFEPAPRPA